MVLSSRPARSPRSLRESALRSLRFRRLPFTMLLTLVYQECIIYASHMQEYCIQPRQAGALSDCLEFGIILSQLATGTSGCLATEVKRQFTAKAVRKWLARLGVKTLFIEPGSPRENGYIESFRGDSLCQHAGRNRGQGQRAQKLQRCFGERLTLLCLYRKGPFASQQAVLSASHGEDPHS